VAQPPASNGSGGSVPTTSTPPPAGGGAALPVVTPPRVGPVVQATLLPNAIRLRGANRPTLKFRLARSARVALVLARKVGHRWRDDGRSKVHPVAAGSHTIDLLRWTHKNRLVKGRYRVTLVAEDSTGAKARRTATMTLSRTVGRRPRH
jgi:hypothetical protein